MIDMTFPTNPIAQQATQAFSAIIAQRISRMCGSIIFYGDISAPPLRLEFRSAPPRSLGLPRFCYSQSMAAEHGVRQVYLKLSCCSGDAGEMGGEIQLLSVPPCAGCMVDVLILKRVVVFAVLGHWRYNGDDVFSFPPRACNRKLMTMDVILEQQC
jgi:hypothetical protein